MKQAIFKHFFRLVGLFLAVFGGHYQAQATHNRAGQIQIEQIGPLTIRATIITYTKSSSVQADRDAQNISWGDDSVEVVRRTNGGGFGEFLPGDVKKNVYIATHTYAGRGTYVIGMLDPNRNGGVLNLNFPNSDAIAFYVQTTYTFLNSNFQGFNSTPQILQPPVDKGCIGRIFVHSLNVYDPDGDSIAFRLTTPLQNKYAPVPLYQYPDRIVPGANNTIVFDERTGQFTWRSPQARGEYNIAFAIISYRGGVAIDTTIRDMQILIEDCQNDPPRIETIEKICVVAGQNIAFNVRATDPNIGQRVSLTALGGPFEVRESKAVFNGSQGFRTPPVQDVFRWQTTCEHIAEYPYVVVFKASDNFFTDSTGLVDLKTVQIKVVGPAPEDVRVASSSGQATVSWRKPYICETAKDRYFFGFSVWRREGSTPFTPDTCNPGLQGRGYTQIAYDTSFQLINGRYSFIDRNVERGKTYCYRIVAHFAKRTTSGNPYNVVMGLPSAEACVQLQRDLPLITNASVEQTSTTIGRVLVRWTKPLGTDLDTITNPGPYKFVVYRSEGITRNGLQAVPVSTVTSSTFAGLNDTVFIDNNLNTAEKAYSYKIAFFVRQDTLLGFSSVASTHFLTVGSTDRALILNIQKDVPWTNTRYDVFRRNTATNTWDSIGTTATTTYRDEGLLNGVNYCYYVRAVGSYGIAGVASPLLNLSQEACGIPIDTVPPCPPVLMVSNNCDTTGVTAESALINLLRWNNPANVCAGSLDLQRYEVFYAPTEGGAFSRIATIGNRADTTLFHKDVQNQTVAGCYYVVAIDSVGNVSAPSNKMCIDNCPIYRLPNAFTPNADGQNDVFIPIRKRYIAKVDFQVFNRWGQMVFQTDAADLNWNGDNTAGNPVADGTYFYVCRVYEQRVEGEVLSPVILKGYIEVIRSY